MSQFKDYTPPFPSNIAVAELETVSLKRLAGGDQEESAKLYASCRTLGFFLLDLRGQQEGDTLLESVDRLFSLSEELYEIPIEHKLQFALRPGTAYGYKEIGVSKVDSKGTPDRCEFWGLSKDEILSQDANRSPMPPLFTKNIEFLQDFVRKAHGICLTIVSHIEANLHLPPGTLTSQHRLTEPSADQIRLLKMAPQKPEDLGTSLLAHTDFGSVTLLWNILGGLQILPQDAGQSDPDGISTKWQYVKPQAGCVIVNMGDAMVSFSGGLIRSNLHRVVPPPGEQAKYTRYSSAYFMRPEDGVFMRAVKGGDVIPPENGEGEGKPYTAKEWVALKSDRSRGPMGQPMKSIGGKL